MAHIIGSIHRTGGQKAVMGTHQAAASWAIYVFSALPGGSACQIISPTTGDFACTPE
jgi:hypothetical protein